MIYIVSADDQTETLRTAGEYGWEAYFSDAKSKAQTLATVNEKPFYIYGFEQCDCVEPAETESQKTYRLKFDRLERKEVTVTATDLNQAIKIGKKQIGDDWDFYIADEITED